MTIGTKLGIGVPRRFLTAAVIVGLGLAGCSKSAGPGEAAQPQTESEAAVARGDTAMASDRSTAGLPPAPMDAWHQPFALATRSSDNPPEGSERPPDTTITSKPVHKILSEVQRLWNDVRFTLPDGKQVLHTATLETAQGRIVIDLRHDWAPNHVRNFVALARAGYYDGLRFDRIVHEESTNPPVKLDQIQAGCPLGTGDFRNGSIGYWLQPEFNDQIHHDEGTVGACHGVEADSAGCRFYINLTRAPFLDGNFTVFGKVVEGMDVVRKIHLQPTIIDDQDVGSSHRPKDPVVIHKVTIQTREGTAPAGTEGK
jgi:cyclophilin family peptidyl-prolyl cis-trans isomerase